MLKKMEKKINELNFKINIITKKTEELNNSIILIKNYIECQQRTTHMYIMPTPDVMPTPSVMSRYNN